jgi:pimeloyl-ACP methyl ester carboxylesterase
MKRSAVALGLLFVGGCVPLIPYDEVRAGVPPENLVEIDGRLAHIARSGRGEPIVLLHGFGASAYSWRHVAATLASEYELIAVDLNGFGYTERPRGAAAYTVAGQLALVLGVMDALGIESAHFAGHSYGGALATHLAWRHPQRVRSLILVDSAGAEYPWERRNASAANKPLTYLFVRTRAIRRKAVLAGLENSFSDDTRITPALVDAYYERIRIDGVSRAFRGLTAPTSEPRELPDLAQLDLPVLLVWGADDELTLPKAAQEAAAVLPHAELEILDGVGHIPLEESPDQLARLMSDFLARHWTE